MKKTTRDNDEKDIMGNRVRRTTPSLCAQRRALRREAGQVLRSILGIPHSHPLDRYKVRAVRVVTRLRTMSGVPSASAEPSALYGAQLTERQPSVESAMVETAQLSSSWCEWIETLPSDDAHARMSPCSCGAHETEFTLAVWPRYAYT